jgi:glycosyltransferase involved in cell wall biosynthesis
MSTVDVVVPCYNYARYLGACVQSVLSQREVDVRVLVIDDASSDETSEIGEKLAHSNGNVEFHRHKTNIGHIATYNEGLIEWATAKYVVLLSADDMLTPGSLRRAVNVMDADNGIGLVYGPVIHFKQDIQLPNISDTRFSYTRFSGVNWLQVRCRAGHNVITSPEVVVRRSIQRAAGGYRPELPHAGDLEMWLRIAALSDLAFIRNVPQAFYRVHPASMTTDRSNFVDMRERKAAFDSFFRHHESIPDVDHLRDAANRALAREALWRACRAYDRDQVEERRANELVEFAMMTYARATALAEYRALRRRKQLGATVCNRTQVFAGSALIRKVQRWLKRQRWKRRGM